MKALVYSDAGALEYRDVPSPVVAEGELQIRIMASGICGSDMHAYLGHDERRPAPLILGHEAAGIVVKGRFAGKRVVINPLITCGACRNCKSGFTNICAKRQIISMPPREGAFAQYVSMPEGNVVFVPDHIPMEAAALTEPIACGWHAVRLGLSALEIPLENVRSVVLGGGAIGVGAALSLSAYGVENITVVESNALRRDGLEKIDRFQVVDSLDTNAPEPGGADLVVDGVGLAATRANACNLVRPGGVITHIGLGDAAGGLDIRRMTLQEIHFIGTYTYTADDFQATANAIFEGRLGALNWVEKRPLAAGARAFEDIRCGRVKSPKTILIPEH